MNIQLNAPAEPDDSEKRLQKYLHFKLMPGDQPLIERLPDPQREILAAKGRYREIAQQLGLPIGTVRSRLHRAREALDRLRRRDNPLPAEGEFH